MFQKNVSPLAKMSVLWAKIYYAFAKELIEKLGEDQGKQLLVECIKRYAQMRGSAVADYVIKNNLEHSAENFVKYYDAPFSTIQKECLALFPEKTLEPSDGTTFCPYKEVWAQLPMGTELGLIYCVEFHKAMWKAYHPKLRVKQDKIMTRGDEMCTFLTFMEGEEANSVFIFDQK